MSNEMIEKIIKIFDIAYPYSCSVENCHECKRFNSNLEAQARAVIKAMREPTEEMLNIDAPDMPAGGSILDIWQTMIDAALKDDT